METTPPVFEDAYAALDYSIAVSGKSKKALATTIYAGRKIETALSLLSRALSPENTDVNLNLEMILTIMRETQPDDFLFWLCDEFGFERPKRRETKSFEQDVRDRMSGISRQLLILTQEMERLEKIKRDESVKE